MNNSSVKEPNIITPSWDAPTNVRALTTTRDGGVSRGPYKSFNLGDHVGDDLQAVSRNRAILRERLPAAPCWLKQVHSTNVVETSDWLSPPEADAAFTFERGKVCAALTADCLPVLLCDRQGTAVAVAHAGWRGLLQGVIEATVEKLQRPPNNLVAWLGPAIGPDAFEVGDDVYQAFANKDSEMVAAFKPLGGGKWLLDIYALAGLQLRKIGINSIYGGKFCTVSDAANFFSYRRDGITGRMATLIWLD